MKTRTKKILKTLLVIIAIIALAWFILKVVIPFVVDILLHYLVFVIIGLAIVGLVAS